MQPARFFRSTQRRTVAWGILRRYGLLLILFAMTIGLPGCMKPPDPPGSKYLILLEITSSDCDSCRRIHPILQDLKPEYDKKLTFVALDVSNPPDRRNAMDTARRFNCETFVKYHLNRPGTVAILNALNGEKMGLLENVTDPKRYPEMIDGVLKRVPTNFPR
jgi:thiol-disulfide isomerase/thioredoxin